MSLLCPECNSNCLRHRLGQCFSVYVEKYIDFYYEDIVASANHFKSVEVASFSITSNLLMWNMLMYICVLPWESPHPVHQVSAVFGTSSPIEARHNSPVGEQISQIGNSLRDSPPVLVVGEPSWGLGCTSAPYVPGALVQPMCALCLVVAQS